MGVFVLHPINEFVYYHEHNTEDISGRKFVFDQLTSSIQGKTPIKTFFYALVGASLGLLTAALYYNADKRNRRILQLSTELEKSLAALIGQGEDSLLEYKSSFRWDFKQGKTNRSLETVIMKTLAGFFNADGGTLLIGVSDDGTVVGLEHDYKTLKKKDRDGFEQALMTAISKRLGTDMCAFVHVVFHTVEGKDVCRLIATGAPRPVYLGQDGDTKFYIRTGPSTRELNIQEAIDYIKNHWGR
jgi:hypothetical protein